MRSSNAFFPCRIEWRPSRLAQAGIAAVAALAMLAVSLSGLSADGRLMLVLVLAIAAHAVVLIRRERGRPDCALLWRGGDGTVEIERNGRLESIGDLRMQRRGSLVQLAYRDSAGRRRRLLWWPDTLNAEQRRRLTIAVSVPAARDSLLPLVAG